MSNYPLHVGGLTSAQIHFDNLLDDSLETLCEKCGGIIADGDPVYEIGNLQPKEVCFDCYQNYLDRPEEER